MSQPPPRPPWPPPPILGAYPVYYPHQPSVQQQSQNSPPIAHTQGGGRILQPLPQLQQVPQTIQPFQVPQQVPQQIQPLPPQQIHQLQQQRIQQQIFQQQQHHLQQQIHQQQIMQHQQQFQHQIQQIQVKEEEEEETVQSLEAALAQAAEKNDDNTVDLCLHKCARAMARNDANLAASATKIAARAARLASGTQRLPRLHSLVDGMLVWAIDGNASRRISLGVTDALGNFGDKVWRAEPQACRNIIDNLNADLNSMINGNELIASKQATPQRIATLVRCLSAILKNAPFPGINEMATDMLELLYNVRQSVPDPDAWDDLITELGQSFIFRNHRRFSEANPSYEEEFPIKLISFLLTTLRRSAADAMTESETEKSSSTNKRKQQRIRRLLDRLTKIQAWCIERKPEKRVSLLAALLGADFDEDEELTQNGNQFRDAIRHASTDSREALVHLGAVLVGEESSCLDFVARVANLTEDPALYRLALDILFRATATSGDLEPFALAVPSIAKCRSHWLDILLEEIKRSDRKQPKHAADAALKAVCKHILFNDQSCPPEIVCVEVILALLEVGASSLQYAEALALALVDIIRTEERLSSVLTATIALARLLTNDENDITDKAIDAAIDAAGSLGGGRDLILTRGRDHPVEICKEIEFATRGIILAVGRLGRAVSFSNDTSENPAACLVSGNVSSPTNKGQRKFQPLPLDSPKWSELGATDADHIEEANILFESLFSTSALDSAPALTTPQRQPTPPPTAVSENDGKSVVVTVESSDSSKRRRNRGGHKKKEPPVIKKQMVLLQRGSATTQGPPVPSPAPAETVGVVSSNPSTEPNSPTTTREVNTTKIKSRICRRDDVARAAARFAVGARLKTRFGSAAKTLAAIRDDLIHGHGTVNTVALVGALEREFAAAAELIPKRSDNSTQDEIVQLFGRQTARPSLAIGAFFRQNRAVCDEWLQSVRIPVAELALQNRLYADAVHHADCSLLDKTDDGLAVAVLARVALGDASGIEAIAVERELEREQWWFTAAVNVAQGHYEPAYDTLLDGLFEDIDKVTPLGARCGLELLARCGSALGLNDDEDVVPGVTALRKVKALEKVVEPKRAALVLDRWAAPPENEALREERIRQWSRVANADVDEILGGHSAGDQDILTVTTLPARCADERIALFDFSRKLAVAATSALNNDYVLRRILDPGRLLPILELVQQGASHDSSSTSSLSDGEDDIHVERRILVAARIALATRQAFCPDLAESALSLIEESLDIANDLPDWSRGLPVFLHLERSRLLRHAKNDEWRSYLFKALNTAVKECTNSNTNIDLKNDDLLFLSSPGKWLEDTLNEVVEFSSNDIKSIVYKFLDAQTNNEDAALGLRCLAQFENYANDDTAVAIRHRSLQGAAMAAVATVHRSASACTVLADWCVAVGGLDAEAKRNFAHVLEIGCDSAESTRLCAIRAARLLLGTDDDDWSARLADKVPAATWSRLAPQLLADAFQRGSQELTTSRCRLLTRVALHAPKSVVHAVVVACREARIKRRALSSAAITDNDDKKSDDELLTTAAAVIEHDDVDDLLQNDDEVDDLEFAAVLPRVNSQRKRRATEAHGDDDEWQRAAVRMRAVRAELALSGESTRALLRGAELCVDELRNLALLPEDKWRQVLASSTLTRLGGPDVSAVRIAAGVDGTINGDDQREELAAFRSRALAAPARRHLERAGRELLENDDDDDESNQSPKESSIYRRVFARRTRPLLKAAIEALAAVESQTRRKIRGGQPFEHRFDDAWHRALEAVGNLRDSVLDKRGWLAAELSPALADPTDDLWLPVVRSDQGYCRVSKLGERVAPLASKTRPKKLWFDCTDGKVRTFLLKGAEDVHLDERVMQLLEVVNDALFKNAITKAHRQTVPHVATYAVLPLSRSSGLIEWVPTTRPLFELYRAEISSRATTAAIAERHKLVKKQGSAGASMEYPEPKAIRYDALPRALYAELEKLGVVTHEPRSTWPVDKLRTAFDVLAQDAPSDLLQRELWRGAVDASAWLARKKNYATRLGASSIAAYALGLGDRHLENVLFDDDDGCVVDVDWGVCFDAGTKLRVPERVPFRLTPVLSKPLTSIRKGVFIDTATSALDALRLGVPGGDSLIQLLELCGSDARVEWRATLGAQQPPAQRHHSSSRPRSRIADERKAAALALLAAQCLDAKDWCSSSLTDRCKRLRDALVAIQVLASPHTLHTFSQVEDDSTSAEKEKKLTTLVESRQRQLRTAKAVREATERIALNLQGNRDHERQSLAISRAAIATAAQTLVTSAVAGLGRSSTVSPENNTSPVVQKLKSRITALTTPTAQLDLNGLRDGDLALVAGARLAHGAMRKSRKTRGSLFTANDPFLFGVSGQQKKKNTAWEDVAETGAVRRLRQADLKKDDPIDFDEVDEDVKQLALFQAECEREMQRFQSFGPPTVDALRVTVKAIEAYLPFVSMSKEERYSPARLEHAAAVAAERRQRVTDALNVLDRSRALATLATARGAARRAVRNSRFRLDAIEILWNELSITARLDGMHTDQTETLLRQATADAVARRLIPRLFMTNDLSSIEPGAIANAAACLAFIDDADVADASLDGPRGIVFASICRLQAGHDFALGLSAIVDSIPEPNTNLRTKLEAIAKACDLSATICRDAGRLFAASLFTVPTDAQSTAWRRTVVAHHQRLSNVRKGTTNALTEHWRALAESAREASTSDFSVFRTLDALTAPLETALEGAGSLCVETDLVSSMAELKLQAMIGVLTARERALTAGEVVCVPYEVLLESQGAEADAAVAVTNAVRTALGLILEGLLVRALDASRNALMTHSHDVKDPRAIEGALALAAAAQLQVRLDHSANADTSKRLQSALARRERLCKALVDARAATAAYKNQTSIQENVDDDDSRILLDEDLVFAQSSLVFRNEAVYAQRASNRAARFGKDRAAAFRQVRSAMAALDAALNTARRGLDIRMARRCIIDSFLSDCVRSGTMTQVEQNDVADWTYRIDAHFAAVIPAMAWLDEARSMLQACDNYQHDDRNAQVDDAKVDIAIKQFDAAAAAEAVASASYDAATKALYSATEAKQSNELLRQTLRELPSIADRLEYDSISGNDGSDDNHQVEETPLSRRARRRLLQKQQQQQQALMTLSHEQKRPAIVPWLELAARCRDLAAHAVIPSENLDNRSNLPPSAKSLSIEARDLEHRFRDLDRIDTGLRACFESEKIRSLLALSESERMTHVASSNNIFLSPDNEILHLAAPVLIEELPSQLLANFLGIARTSCRAAAAVLEFNDVENVQRFDGHINWKSVTDDDSQQENDIISPKPSRPSTTRKDAARSALEAVRRKLDASIQGSSEDQLSTLVKIATDPSELCLMYEGWAPWV